MLARTRHFLKIGLDSFIQNTFLQAFYVVIKLDIKLESSKRGFAGNQRNNSLKIITKSLCVRYYAENYIS